MKFYENKGAQVYRVLPETDVEIRVLDELLKLLFKDEKLFYRHAQMNEDGSVKSIQMFVGVQMFPSPERTKAAPSAEESVVSLQDGFFLHPSDAEDRLVLGRLQKIAARCGGLILHDVQYLGDIVALEFIGCYCSKCHSTIIQPDRCEWQLCLNCAKLCEHQTVHGLIKKDGCAKFGHYCPKCGLHR